MPRRALVGPAAAALCLGLIAGCSTPPWQQPDPTASTAASGSPGASAGPTLSPGPSGSGPGSAGTTPAPSPSATTAPPVNDLAKGSTQRTVTAGAISVKISYWSTTDMGQWTPEANKPLTMSLSASLDGGGKQGVFLTKVTLTPSVTGPTPGLPGPKPLVDAATVKPGYQIAKPNSYQQVFTIPALDPAATSITLSITYEMLLQTTPTSSEYAKLTAGDTLTITLA